MQSDQPIQPGEIALPKAALPATPAGSSDPASFVVPQPAASLAATTPGQPVSSGNDQSMIRLRSRNGLNLNAVNDQVEGSAFSDVATIATSVTMAQPAPAPAPSSLPPTSSQPSAETPLAVTASQTQPPLTPNSTSSAYPAPSAELPYAPNQSLTEPIQSAVQSNPAQMSSSNTLPVVNVTRPLATPSPIPPDQPTLQLPTPAGNATAVNSPPQPSAQFPVSNQPAPPAAVNQSVPPSVLTPTPSPAPTPTPPGSQSPSPAPTSNQPAGQQPKTEPAAKNSTKQRDWVVFAALAVAIISVLAQIFVSGTAGYAIVLAGLAVVAIFLGIKTIRGPKRGMAVAAVILGALAFISAIVQAGIAIRIDQKCKNDPVYAAENTQCQR